MQRMRRSYWFGDRSFYHMALTVAVPIMIQNGITQFVGLLDNIMVGNVGTLPMSAVGIANQLLLVYNLSIFGALGGAGIFGAQFYGKGDTDGVRESFRFKLIIAAILTAIGTAVFLLLDEPLISLYLQGEATAADRAATLVYARQYLRIILISFVPFMLSQSYSSTLRECGQTVVPMVAGIAGVAVNLVLNAILIYGLIGFPALGIEGAAIATVVSRVVEAAIVMLWTHRHSAEQPFILGAYRSLRIPRALLTEIVKKSMPLLINELLWSAGVAMESMAYSMHGLVVVSAQAISSTISNVFNVAFMAMGSAIGIIVGQLLGAGRTGEAVETDRKLIVFAVLICFGIGAVMYFVAPWIPMLYATTEDVASLATRLIRCAAVCMPLWSLGNACYFTLRSGGKTFITFLFDSCFVWVICVPVAFGLTWWTDIEIVPLYLIVCAT